MNRRYLWVLAWVAFVAVGVVVLVAVVNHKRNAPCPYIGTPPGQPLGASERAWALSTLGSDTVNRCWPG